MAAQSNPVQIGTLAPDFALPDPAGKIVSLADGVGSHGTVVAFLCNHCPYVVHIRHALAEFARTYHGKGIRVIGISANDVDAYPADAPEKMAEIAPLLGFPYLYDESQQVARAYDAACTPDLYLFDASRRLYYHGRFDATRPGGAPADGADLRAAADALLAGHAPAAESFPGIGCSIKWKADR